MSNVLLPLAVEPIPRLALRRPEMAEALGVSDRTLSGWDAVPTVRIGGCVMYPVEQVREWLADEAEKQSAPKQKRSPTSEPVTVSHLSLSRETCLATGRRATKD